MGEFNSGGHYIYYCGQESLRKQWSTPHSQQKVQNAVRACVLSHFSRVRLSATPWTVARQALLSMGFSRQEYWRGLPFPSPQNAVLGCNLKNDKMILIHFQGKDFNITVIQVYDPTSNAKDAEAEWFYEDLHRTNTKKDVLLSQRIGMQK